MKFCPKCLRRFGDEQEHCPRHEDADLDHILLPPKLRYLCIGLVCMLAIGAGAYVTGGYPLDLGSLTGPSAIHRKFMGIWFFVGGLATLSLAAWFAPWLTSTGRAALLRRCWAKGSDSLWIGLGAVLAVVIPALIRLFVLDGVALVDDDSTYEYAARLLAGGHLSESSPPLKLFFDRQFIFNDGHRFTQYYLGWPALMVPGVWLGLEGFINCFYAGLTVPAIFLVARRLFGSNHARLALVLFLTSPLFMTGAATQMSHTSCMLMLSWMLWFYLNCRDGLAPALNYFGVAASFGIAFFIRPSSALGVGLPVLLALAYCWVRHQRGLRAKARTALAFVVPGAVLAALFFLVNDHHTGSPLGSAYKTVFDYVEANGFRFTKWTAADADDLLMNRHGPAIWPVFAVYALVRMNFALLGWPFAVVFALYGNFRRDKLLWAMVVFYMLLHLPVSDVGVESYGPVHYFEIGLPLLFLVCAAAIHLSQRLVGEPEADDNGISETLAVWPYAVIATMVALNLAVYTPVKLHAVARISNVVERPHRAVEQASLTKPAVVFVAAQEYGDYFIGTSVFSPPCAQDAPTHHFVNWRPVNPPSLDAEILWVNHISLWADKKLMAELFPERTGYLLMRNTACQIRLVPVDKVDEDKEFAPTVPPHKLESMYKPPGEAKKSDVAR